jgi:thiamine pyrophosphokinase
LFSSLSPARCLKVCVGRYNNKKKFAKKTSAEKKERNLNVHYCFISIKQVQAGVHLNAHDVKYSLRDRRSFAVPFIVVSGSTLKTKTKNKIVFTCKLHESTFPLIKSRMVLSLRHRHKWKS